MRLAVRRLRIETRCRLQASALRDGKTNRLPLFPCLTITGSNGNRGLGFQGQYDGKDGQDAECLDRDSALAGVTPTMSVKPLLSFTLFMDDCTVEGLVVLVDRGMVPRYYASYLLLSLKRCHIKGVFRPFFTSNAYQKISLSSSTYPPSASSLS